MSTMALKGMYLARQLISTLLPVIHAQGTFGPYWLQTRLYGWQDTVLDASMASMQSEGLVGMEGLAAMGDAAI